MAVFSSFLPGMTMHGYQDACELNTLLTKHKELEFAGTRRSASQLLKSSKDLSFRAQRGIFLGFELEKNKRRRYSLLRPGWQIVLELCRGPINRLPRR
jgi:hypothetical protein